MGSDHYIYIPLVLFAGMLLGFWFGGRAARDAYNMQLRRDEERREARAARAARKAERGAAADSDD